MATLADRPCAAFDGARRIAVGPLAQVALAARAWLDAHPRAAVLVFDDATGRVVDLDLRGGDAEIFARLPALAAVFPPSPDEEPPQATPGPRGRGRPRLGVVAREVTLLPRHWAWLSAQPGGASVALRKLVDQARREQEGPDTARRGIEAAYRVMSALAGDLPEFEEAARALFAGDAVRFAARLEAWPPDVAAYVTSLAFPPAG